MGGVPATIFRPGRGSGPWPAVVVVPGVTRLGRRHPGLVGLGRGLAATGHLAGIAEPEGLVTGELTPATVLETRKAAEAAASWADAEQGRVALLGVSGGATLALLAAADSALAGLVSFVAALAPCCDIREAIRVVTTGVYRDGDALVPFATGDLFKLVIARSVVAWLPVGRDRTALRSHLLERDEYGPEPLADLRAWPRDELGASALAALELLANEDRDRFEELFAALPDELRAAVEMLSPTQCAQRIVAPTEVVVAREDRYIPLTDSTVFSELCPTARLTVLESLGHAVPSLSPAGARDLLRLDGVLVRLAATSYSLR